MKLCLNKIEKKNQFLSKTAAVFEQKVLCWQRYTMKIYSSRRAHINVSVNNFTYLYKTVNSVGGSIHLHSVRRIVK